MLSIINKLDSGTIKGLIAATVPLLGLIATLFGVDKAVFDAAADKWVQILLAFLAAGGVAWAAWARLFQPTPPLTETALMKTDQMVRSGAIKVTPKAGGFFRPAFALVLAGLAVFGLTLLEGCAVNPHKTAQSVEQHADAVYGEVTILKEQGARVLKDASVADAIKRPIAQAIVDAQPITDGLQDSLILYARVKAEVAAGTNTQAQLAVVDRELAGWIDQARPIINRLTAALAGAK